MYQDLSCCNMTQCLHDSCSAQDFSVSELLAGKFLRTGSPCLGIQGNLPYKPKLKQPCTNGPELVRRCVASLAKSVAMKLISRRHLFLRSGGLLGLGGLKNLKLSQTASNHLIESHLSAYILTHMKSADKK